jgi:Domain of unknown function (DUF3597)
MMSQQIAPGKNHDEHFRKYNGLDLWTFSQSTRCRGDRKRAGGNYCQPIRDGLNYSASMNMWLHKQVMTKLGENGGKVPDELKA